MFKLQLNPFTRLRLGYIFTSTVTVAVMLGAVLFAVNLVTYVQSYREQRAVLDAIVKNGGELPDDQDEGADTLAIAGFSSTNDQPVYFTVVFDRDGEVVSSNVNHIIAVDDETAISVASDKLESLPESAVFTWWGTSYMYLQHEYSAAEVAEMDVSTRRAANISEGDTIVAVVNCREFRLFSATVRYSLCLGIGFLVIYVLLISFFSKRSTEPIIQSIKSQREFVTNASHELKTPVAVIMANTELLEMTGGENEWTRSIRHQSERLTNLVNRLIALARLQEREDQIIEDVSLTAAVEESVGAYRTVIEGDGRTLETSVEENVTVRAERRALGELVNILIDNANKYCDEGGVVSVTLQRGGRAKMRALLVVTNDYADGEGVDYTRFFDRFYREDSSHSNERAGYGIGLSMASQITNNFKGKIWASYKDGKISFSVSLPLRLIGR